MASARPLRVALLATSVEFGGIERVLLNMVQHMDREVELVPVVFTRTDTSENSFFDRLRALAIPYETLYVNSIRPYLLLNPIVNLAQAAGLFRRRRFDLIHSHGYRADVFALALAKWCGLPVVSTCHGFVGIDSRLRLYNALDARVLRFFTRVIAVSGRMKKDLVAHGLDEARVDVITNAVAQVSSTERAGVRRTLRATLGIADDDFVFGYVGRLSEEKGVAHLIQAIARMSGSPRRVRAIVVGDGPQRAALEQRARERRVAADVTFAGFQADTAPWYSAMDAFVLPSLTEGTPMALLEAMASGVPVIASEVGGVPAVVAHGQNGLLVPPADAERLAEAMRRFVSSPALREDLAARGVQAVRGRYDVSTWVRNVRDVYGRSLQDAVPAR